MASNQLVYPKQDDLVGNFLGWFEVFPFYSSLKPTAKAPSKVANWANYHKHQPNVGKCTWILWVTSKAPWKLMVEEVILLFWVSASFAVGFFGFCIEVKLSVSAKPGFLRGWYIPCRVGVLNFNPFWKKKLVKVDHFRKDQGLTTKIIIETASGQKLKKWNHHTYQLLSIRDLDRPPESGGHRFQALKRSPKIRHPNGGHEPEEPGKGFLGCIWGWNTIHS